MLTTNKVKTPRSFRIVGPQRQIDERETPHPKVDRGEFGARLRDWRKNRVGGDPFRRLFGGGGEGDPNNTLQKIMRDAPEGKVNPNQIPVDDPAEMAEQIKGVAKYLGADVVGITRLDQLYVYSHRARGNAAMGEKPGDPVNLPHRYAICLGFASDYYRYMSNNSKISDTEYQFGNNHAIVPTFMLASYIREMGYPATAHHHGRSLVNPIPLAINAGLGELGRHGMLIHEKYGSRLHLTVVTTDLPLAVDEPVDIGVEEFCKYCKKCARTCPSHTLWRKRNLKRRGEIPCQHRDLLQIQAGRPRGVDQLCRLRFIVLLQQTRYLVARCGHVVGKENSALPTRADCQTAALDR